MNTKESIKEMLTEKTGKNMLDSGDAYGRHWEKNQERAFDEEPQVLVNFIGGQAEYAVNIYHYLKEILEIDNFSKKLDQYLQETEVHWVNEAMEALESLFINVKKGEVENTYNYESNLSQVLLFQVFTLELAEEEEDILYVFLQIHQGCDVRGGYTDVRCFKLVGLIDPLVDIIGTIEDQEVETLDDGINLTDEKGDKVQFNEGMNYSLQIRPFYENEIELSEIYLS